VSAQESILLEVALIAALCGHAFVRRFLLACGICVGIEVLTCLVFLGIDFVRLGLRPAKLFWVPSILCVQGGYALVIAAVVGLPFYLYRRRIRSHVQQTSQSYHDT
jgi:hypothetical protein